MFGLSFGELLIIFAVALLVLGPSGLPKLARTLGKTLRQFRGATAGIREAVEEEFYRMDKPPPPQPIAPPNVVPRPGAGLSPNEPGGVRAFVGKATEDAPAAPAEAVPVPSPPPAPDEQAARDPAPTPRSTEEPTS